MLKMSGNVLQPYNQMQKSTSFFYAIVGLRIIHHPIRTSLAFPSLPIEEGLTRTWHAFVSIPDRVLPLTCDAFPSVEVRSGAGAEAFMGSAAPCLRVLAGHAGPVNLIPVGCAGDAGLVCGEVRVGGRTEALDQREIEGHPLGAACAFAGRRIEVEILGATVTGVGCIVPESRQIAGLALFGRIVPSLRQVTGHTEVVSCQVRRIRGAHAELGLQIIVKSFGAGHAGQLVGVPYSRAGAGHAQLVEVHIGGVAWADACCVIRIEDVGRRTGHATLLSRIPVARLIACHALPLRIYVRCSHRTNAGLCLHNHLIGLGTSHALLESGIVPRIRRTDLALKIRLVPEVRSSAFHALLLLGEEVPLWRALTGHCSHVEDIGFRAASLVDCLQVLQFLPRSGKGQHQSKHHQGFDEHLNMFYINLKYFLLINPKVKGMDSSH